MIFLFSSFTGLPDRYFNGYVFCGNDFISGSKGAADFQKASGQEIRAGLDGCYFSVWKEGSCHRMGVDHSGYKKIFYYSHRGVWGISNSISRLAEHLRKNGVELPPDFVQLRSLGVDNTVSSQMAAFRTMISGIVLLPSSCEMGVLDGNLRVIKRDPVSVSDYRSALECFLETWVGRLETLICDPRVQLTCDLTGGNDSRLVFGLLMKARVRLGLVGNDLCYVRSGTGDRWKSDLEAATTIAKHYGITLNRPVPRPEGVRRYGNALSYSNWKDLNICAYFPVYFAPRASSRLSLHLHGGGGENHREFYNYGTYENFARKTLSARFTSDPLLEYWVGSVGDSIRDLKGDSPNVSDWILHYREFRSRFHGGRSPQYRNVLSPLASREMEQLSNFPGKTSRAQAHFDVMSSLLPELVHFPYDSPAKAPSAGVLQNLTLVAIGSGASPGAVYIDPDEGEAESESGSGSPLEMLLEDFSSANTPEVRELVPEVVKKALRASNEVVGRNSFGHASDGKNMSRVISAAFALSRK